MAKPDLTAAQLRELLHYDPATGIFTWRPRPIETFADSATGRRWNNRYAGKPAGYQRPDGYFDIRLLNALFRAHRLAWLYMTGKWPTSLVDHRDRRPENTSWENLREATHSENRQNQGIRSDCRSPFQGIERHKSGLWRARLTIGKKRVHLGYFKTQEEAKAARLEGERIHFTHSPACAPQVESREAGGQLGDAQESPL